MLIRQRVGVLAPLPADYCGRVHLVVMQGRDQDVDTSFDEQPLAASKI